MTAFVWWLVDLLARLLDPAEGEAVRGDLAEANTPAAQALAGIFGLVARRQASLWTSWRPWVALIALVIPGALLLSFAARIEAYSTVFFWAYLNKQFLNNWTWADLAPGYRADLATFIAKTFLDYVVLACLAGTAGFVLARVSRRSIAINGALFCLLLLADETLASFPGNVYRVVFPIALLVMVMLPSIYGMRLASRFATIPRLLVAALSLAAIAPLPLGIPLPPAIRQIIECLPVFYILAAALRERFATPLR